MPTVKMRAPENFSALTLGGRSVDVGGDGAYHADHRDVDTLAAHGFTPWPADVTEPGKDVATMNRSELIELAVAHVRADLADVDTETIRRRLMAAEGEPEDIEDLSVPTDAELAEAKVNANEMTSERIATMKRNELFAYLKAEGVSVSPPITNDRLREIALDTLKRKQTA